jgi:hypothetical protein
MNPSPLPILTAAALAADALACAPSLTATDTPEAIVATLVSATLTSPAPSHTG